MKKFLAALLALVLVLSMLPAALAEEPITITVFRAKSYENQNFTEETISTLKEGDEVVFEGELQKYVKNGVTTPEIKNCYLISINGKDAASVKAVRTDLDANAPAYNVGGQKVSDNYRGLVIQNGRKYINK